MQVLLFLIQKSGQNVTKEQIIAHVWNGSIVNEEILSVAISKIRKSLGDNARQPTFIKTIPNVGYCLVAAVKPLVEKTPPLEAPSNTLSLQNNNHKHYFIGSTLLSLTIIFIVIFYQTYQESTHDGQVAISSIAVLPFEDLSEGQDNQYFSDGLSDSIINQLSQTKPLKVISRYSSFNFRGNRDPSTIGNSLKVEAFLDGSVQKSAEQIRVSVRIFSTFDGRLLWSKNFDSNNKDVFNLQDQISREVQSAIQPNSKPQLGTTRQINSQAYEWFLMAQYHWQQRTPASLSKAETYFKHSLELEPNYVDAYIGLAITYAQFHYHANWSAKESVYKGLPYIEQALALDPNSPRALAAKGMLLTLKGSYSNATISIQNEAQDMFIRSLELEDNATTHHWYSSLLNNMGKKALVAKHMEHAIDLNPLSASLKITFSEYLAKRGKLDTAQKLFNRAQILEPDRDSSIIKSTHVFRNTPRSIIAIAEWHSRNSQLFEYCSSYEYCEQVIFSYLSIGQESEANKILARMPSKHQHFTDSLKLIDYGLTGKTNDAVLLFENLSEKRPNNYKYKYSLAVAQFRAGLFEQAKSSTLKLYPNWSKSSLGLASIVNSDNYLALVLYGGILLELGEQEFATALLNNVSEFLKLNKVQDKAQAELTLAEINALLSNTTEAIKHLEKALNKGWLETYDREWWPLQDNHLLKSINSNPKFKNLIAEHSENLAKMSNQISLKLAPL
ncbi:hypothetical protein ATS75_04200 [Pseudoalteromonas sp. H105]|nr:hypothetical protein ATS75_04200 [Pseudoalteromonas sp. H105]